MCYHVKNIWVVKIFGAVRFKAWMSQRRSHFDHVLPAAATLHGEEGSAPVTVMLSLSLVTMSPMSPDVSLLTTGPGLCSLSTISRLLSRSDLEQDQAFNYPLSQLVCSCYRLHIGRKWPSRRSYTGQGLHLASPRSVSVDTAW